MAHGKKLPCAVNLANGKSQNVHTAELGYLGFQDYLKNLQLCSFKIKGSHTPWTSHAAAL